MVVPAVPPYLARHSGWLIDWLVLQRKAGPYEP
jgi:hypothetical protein